ncbi:MAG: helix-turn-helix domain-containing protein [Desulfovibrio sp.]|uniref:LexA family protein n=1 Tax=Desulfovibrio sp. TaxID=885 RepID=UPI00135F0BEE|nr:helix-turn-helix domain-containing protein [Desulfovibrio sp.]MTJ93868.1 helix-turn-helix domain-containing protein [Desulfovibrio sp.]
MLTSRQNELLSLIYETIKETGISPTIDEIRDRLGLKSKSSVHRMLDCLEERGFIRRLSRRARALEIIKMPPAPGVFRTQDGAGVVYTLRRNDTGQPVTIERNGVPFLAIISIDQSDDDEIEAVVDVLNTAASGASSLLKARA